MNTDNVISNVQAADLSGKEFCIVKMTSTGIDLAATGERVVGTLIRAAIKQEPIITIDPSGTSTTTAGTGIGKACAVQLKAGSVHYARLGITAGSLAKGAGLIIDVANPGYMTASETSPIAIVWQAITSAQALGSVIEVVFI